MRAGFQNSPHFLQSATMDTPVPIDLEKKNLRALYAIEVLLVAIKTEFSRSLKATKHGLK